MNLDLDAQNNRATLSDNDDPAWKGQLSLEKPDPKSLVIRGTVNGAGIAGKLHLMDESKFILTSRGFHLINERPF